MESSSPPRPAAVLLVQSAQDDREMYKESLRLAGLRVIDTDDTADALALAPAVDVIVTGVRLSGPFDGFELVRRLRADGRTRDKPVIVLTACALEREQESAQVAGGDVFLRKPCLPDDLIEQIQRALKLRVVSRPRPLQAPARLPGKHDVA